MNNNTSHLKITKEPKQKSRLGTASNQNYGGGGGGGGGASAHICFCSIFKVTVGNKSTNIYKIIVSCKIGIARRRPFARAFLL